MKKGVLTLIISLLVTTCFAETKEELQSKIDSTNAEIKKLEQEISDYNSRVNKTQGEAKTLKEALSRLESQKKILEKRVNSTSLQLDKTRTDIILTQISINSTETDIKNQKKGLGELLRSAYQSSKTNPSFFSLLSSHGNLSDNVEKLIRIDSVSKELKTKTDNLTVSKLDLEDKKSSYEEKHAELKTLKETLSSQKEVVLETAKEKNELLAETKNKESEYKKMIAEKKERKLALEKEIGDFEAKLKAVIDVTKIPKYGSGALAYPVEKVIITQYFGNTPFATANSQVYSGRGHNGIDFGVPVGSKLLAAQDGTVLGTGNTDAACPGASYGKWVLIRHSNGLTSLYAHLSNPLVSTGQTVKQGDIIGLSGNTGYSTGPHLHFTVYASDAVHITGPTEYKSKACGTYLIMPVSPTGGYLNPLSFFK